MTACSNDDRQRNNMIDYKRVGAVKNSKQYCMPIDWECMMVRRQEDGGRNLVSKGTKARV